MPLLPFKLGVFAMQVVVKASRWASVLALTGCAALNFGWYKPGVSQEEFAQDKFACMSGSQMQVSTSNVNGTGSTYYGGGNVTCNTEGSMTNCSGGGGYSQPGQITGSSASYVTTNVPLFQACMQARGYAWTNQAAVNRYESNRSTERGARAQYEEIVQSNSGFHACLRRFIAAGLSDAVGYDKCSTDVNSDPSDYQHELARAAASRAAAGISAERYDAARARCRARAGENPLCDMLTDKDVLASEALAAKAH